MHTFDYSHLPQELLTVDIMNMVSTIHEHKGRQDLFVNQRPNELALLCEVAKIQSTAASNRIEGIVTSNSRLTEIMQEKVAPRNRNEAELAGYRDVLSLIHESHDTIPITPNYILQLHKILYAQGNESIGGRWKDVDNSIVEIDASGNRFERFRPLPAIAVPDAMEQLCQSYRQARTTGNIDSLILTSLFVFDFLCIHPFNDGNGRMSRLLTLLLLYQNGYVVGKYVSVEHEIERSKETYYEALQASSTGWDRQENTYLPFVSYYLWCIGHTFDVFEERITGIITNKVPKQKRIEQVLEGSIRNLSKRDILTQCPYISETTVERTLSALLKDGKIQKVGGGRSTRYRWIRH
ncbi:MAG: Fic family protein [Coriobacteriales bacterium]|nr:Fic family protein [Coriobacteriales bacterium]